jgi:uncharacterized protein YjbI with pentapeptide repeats
VQAALLNRAQLQGASLVGAQLQGANLYGAQLQAALLNRAQLQSASLDGAQLQAAFLFGAQLQGALLNRAQLQGASLRDVFVWRAKPPATDKTEGAEILDPESKPKYANLYCELGNPCDWNEEAYAALKASIEMVPEGQARDNALHRIAPLGQKPYDEDAASASSWRELATKSQRSTEAYFGGLAKRLIEIGCAGAAPYVVNGIIAPLKFLLTPVPKAEVANAFLNGANCPGAKGLSEENEAELRRMLVVDGQRPNPGTASR